MLHAHGGRNGVTGRLPSDPPEAHPPGVCLDALEAVESRYRLTLDVVPDGVMVFDVVDDEAIPAVANPAAVELLGLEAAGLALEDVRTGDLDVLDEEGATLARHESPVGRILREGAPVDDQVWGLRRTDGVVWVRSSGRPLFDGAGRLTGIVLSLVDVTDERRAYDQLEAAHARYEALIEHSTDVIVVVAADGKVLYVSPSYARTLGEDGRAASGRSIFERVHPADQVRVQIELLDLARNPAAVASFRCRVQAADGHYRHFDVSSVNRLDDPAVAGIVANCRDVTEQVEAAAKLTHHATHDQLTGLANRVLMFDRLAAALARARRSGRPLALLFCDLDNFKLVNDTLGHPAGDRLLTTVATRIIDTLRPGDSVARFGGDEFVILAEDVTSRSDAITMADRVRASVAEPVDLNGRRVAIGCSVGIAMSADAQPDTMLQEADIALFRAKAQGRGRSQLYSTMMRSLASDQLDTEELLRRALDDDRVQTFYQPIVNLETGRPASVEALVRIKDQDGTLIPPDRFISVAEDNGLIVPLGERVLEQSCAQMARWLAEGVGISKVTVNLSARQLTAGGLTLHIEGALARHGLAGHHLGIEITESSLIDAGSSARQQIEHLKAIGASILLDDFGTGWSSLAYLRQFPVDGIKVDRSFVSGLGRSTSDTELVRAVVSLGRSLSLDVVAEGVETREHVAELRRLRCPSGQGYLFARPSEPAALVDLLRSASVA